MVGTLRILCIVGLCFALNGCGRRGDYSGPQRYPVSGNVTVDGQPLDWGSISFIPAGADGQRVSGGPIADGAYAVPEEMGANAGQYRVEIRWAKKTGRKLRDPDSGELRDERKEGLPARYHQQSELTAEVSATKTTFDFDVRSK